MGARGAASENRIIKYIDNKSKRSLKKYERFSLMDKKIIDSEAARIFSEVNSLDSLLIDNSKLLGFKKGDLNLIHSTTIKCRHKSYQEFGLILKKLECLDQSIYNMKVHEIDLHLRYSHHPNIVTLYTYWNTQPDNVFSYKNIYLLFEEALVGDLGSCLISNILKASKKLVMKYICDLSKALCILHQGDTIHGGVRPGNLFINEINDLVIGPIKKSELESMRKTRHLLSKFCIERYMKHYFVYWAPEVMLDQPITRGSDVWALGVVLFVLLTGQYPFDVKNEEQTVNNIVSCNVNWRLLVNYPRVTIMLRNVFLKEPEDRWTSDKILAFCQEDFAVIIQRFWRGCLARVRFNKQCHSLLKIQAMAKGWIVRRRYKRKRFEVRWHAAETIKRNIKKYRNAKNYRQAKKLIQMLQANVLSRQTRRAYLKLKKDTITAQS